MTERFADITAISPIKEDGIKGVCLVTALWPVAPDATLWYKLLELDGETPLHLTHRAIEQAKNYQRFIVLQLEEGLFELPFAGDIHDDFYFETEFGVHCWAKYALITLDILFIHSQQQQSINYPIASEFVDQISHLLYPFADPDLSAELFLERGKLFITYTEWLEFLQSNLANQVIEVAQFCLRASEAIDNFNYGLDFINADEEFQQDQQEALEYIYRAHETDDPEDKRNFILMALAIDPLCVDALLLQVHDESNLSEKINRLSEIKNIAECQLPSFMADEVGNYWNIMEARPYMRTLNELMRCLRTAHRRDEAINIAQELCLLDHNDEQGCRYWLILLLIETNQLPKALACINQYPDDSDWMRWLRLLITLLSKQPSTQHFTLAHQSNPAITLRLLDLPYHQVDKQQRHRAEYFYQLSKFIWLNQPYAREQLKQHYRAI